METEEDRTAIDLTAYPTLMVTTELCMTDQGNFPHDRLRPWASAEGVCENCGQVVAVERVAPDNPYMYSHIAVPHERRVAWRVIREDELKGLIRYTQEW